MSKCPKCGAPAKHGPPDGDFRYVPPSVSRAILQAKQEAYEDAAKVASQEWRRWGNKPNDALYEVDKRACEAVAAALRAKAKELHQGGEG